MEYTWKVTGLKTINIETNTNTVIQTYWEKIGKDDDDNEGKFMGATPFRSEDVNPDNFIPFEQLTEEIVLSWIKEIVVGEYEEHVNRQILNQINQDKAQQPSLPWEPQTLGT